MDQEILDALEDPEVTYTQTDRGRGGEAIVQKGDLALGVNVEAKVVKTVLLRSVDRWEHALG
jgi:hypothetical protein